MYLIAAGAVNGVKDIGNWQCAQMLQINGQRFDHCISCGVLNAAGVQQLPHLEQEYRRLLSQQEETLFRNEWTVLTRRHYQSLYVRSAKLTGHCYIRSTNDKEAVTHLALFSNFCNIFESVNTSSDKSKSKRGRCVKCLPLFWTNLSSAHPMKLAGAKQYWFATSSPIQSK